MVSRSVITRATRLSSIRLESPTSPTSTTIRRRIPVSCTSWSASTIDGGKTLEVNVRVEDPGAFTMPWNAIQRYRRTNSGPLSEVVCAENNDDHFRHGLEPMPQADKPDF